MKLFHGGKSGLDVGDELLPSPPHVTDGCPICVARAEGRDCTIGEYRHWLRQFGQAAVPILLKLKEESDFSIIDPSSERQAVYVTTDLEYAASYAGRSSGDLYEVTAIGPLTPSETDHFPTWTCERAIVVRVIRREVRRSRRERRSLERRWKKADKRVAKMREEPSRG